MADGANDAVTKAKSALGVAKNFTKSVEGKDTGRFAPKAPMAQSTVKPQPAMDKAVPSGTPGALAAKQANVEQYEKVAGPVLPKMHKGGMVPGKPGEEKNVILEAGEKVTPAKKDAESMMTKDEPKSKAGDKKKKKHHSYKRTVIDHHSDGSHTMTHEHETDPMQNVTGAKPDLDGVHDGLEENIGGGPMAEAQAPAAGAAPAGGAAPVTPAAQMLGA